MVKTSDHVIAEMCKSFTPGDFRWLWSQLRFSTLSFISRHSTKWIFLVLNRKKKKTEFISYAFLNVRNFSFSIHVEVLEFLYMYWISTCRIIKIYLHISSLWFITLFNSIFKVKKLY